MNWELVFGLLNTVPSGAGFGFRRGRGRRSWSPGVTPLGVGRAIGVLIERVVEVLRDADVGVAVHGEGVLAAGLLRHGREIRGGVALGAMGVLRSDAEVELPPPLLGCGDVYRVPGGTPNGEASYFELNWLSSLEVS